MDGSLHAATPSELVGEALRTWCVSQDGFSIAFTLAPDELASSPPRMLN